MKINYKMELEPVSFIAGDYQEFQYDITDTTTGKGVNFADSDIVIKFIIYPYGDNESPILILDSTSGDDIVKSTSSFIVKIKSDYTKNLNNGLYVHQLIIIDTDNDEFRPCQGLINILPRGKEENAI